MSTIASLAASAANSSGSSSTTNASLNLQASDFINLMVTQLQNQDPTQPTSSQDLLTQMSQIGQLESATDLQSSLKGLVLQNQIGSSSSLIGKKVKGIDAANTEVHGVVSSVSVASDNVTLQLSNGSSLPIANVSSISSAATAATSAS